MLKVKNQSVSTLLFYLIDTVKVYCYVWYVLTYC